MSKSTTRLAITLACALLLTTVMTPLFSAETLAPPTDCISLSNNQAFTANGSVDEHSTVVSSVEGSKQPPWKVSDFSPVTYICNDGRSLAICYSGNNMVPQNSPGSLVLITFYNHNQQPVVTTLSDIAAPSQLLRAPSHDTFGQFIGFDNNNLFEIRRNDSTILTIDPATGKEIGISTTFKLLSIIATTAVITTFIILYYKHRRRN